MKLYYSPGACSLAPHIVLNEAGYKFELEKVDTKTKKTESGKDFWSISDKGYVPALAIDSGEVISEGVAIVQYLADTKPESGLAPKAGTMERVRLNEWLNYISTELHKGFAPLWHRINDEATEAAKKKLASRFEYLESKLKGKDFLTGSSFSVADAYLFTVLNWAKPNGIDLGEYPAITAFMKRVAARPSVQKALESEGLLKAAA